MKPQKINTAAANVFCGLNHEKYDSVCLIFQKETKFGNISKPKYCRCKNGTSTCVSYHNNREYIYAYGAVEPLTGESFSQSCYRIQE